MLVVVATGLIGTQARGLSPTLVYHPTDPVVAMTGAEKTLAQEVEKLLAASCGAAPKPDPVLVDAARRLLGSQIQARDALLAAGATDAYAVPLAFTVTDTAAPMAPIRSVLEKHIAPLGATHYGVGVVGGDQPARIALFFVRRGADIGRFPKRFRHGERYLLSGTLGPGLTRPRVLVSTPRGRVVEAKPRFEHRIFWTTIRFSEGAGRYGVEVQAEGAYGTQVLNLMEVHVSEPGAPLESPVVRLSPPLVPVRTAQLAEERALALINRTRRNAGLPPVSLARRLVRAARSHSQDMARRGYFGHKSPSHGGLARRLTKAGFGRSPLARENIAIGPHPDVAHSELCRSPSHLRNILDPHVSHVGIGVHRSENGPQAVFTFTQIFARLGD